MTNKNYRDPAVWAEFLKTHGFPSDTPPPSGAFCEALGSASDVDAELIKWARRHDPEELRRIERDHKEACDEACQQSAEFLHWLDLDR